MSENHMDIAQVRAMQAMLDTLGSELSQSRVEATYWRMKFEESQQSHNYLLAALDRADVNVAEVLAGLEVPEGAEPAPETISEDSEADAGEESDDATAAP